MKNPAFNLLVFHLTHPSLTNAYTILLLYTKLKYWNSTTHTHITVVTTTVVLIQHHPHLGKQRPYQPYSYSFAPFLLLWYRVQKMVVEGEMRRRKNRRFYFSLCLLWDESGSTLQEISCCLVSHATGSRSRGPKIGLIAVVISISSCYYRMIF